MLVIVEHLAIESQSSHFADNRKFAYHHTRNLIPSLTSVEKQPEQRLREQSQAVILC